MTGASVATEQVDAVLVDPTARSIRVGRVPAPDDGRGVLVRTLEVGVCGTDREIASFEYGTPPPGSTELVLGHEALGRVEHAPPDSGFAPGDLVVPMVRRPCARPDCPACRAGRADFCSTGEFRERGIKELGGFMVERFAEEPRWLVPVPPDLRDVAVLCEPLTIAEKALDEVVGIQARLPWRDASPGGSPAAGMSALVLGSGPVGLLGAMLLRLAGCEVAVYARAPEPNAKAEAAHALGCRYLSAEQAPVDRLGAAVGPVDLVYEATGASELGFAAIRQSSANAVVVLTGVPGRRGPVPMEADALMRELVLGNRVLLGSVNAPRRAYERAVEHLAQARERWPGAVEALITSRHRLSEVPALLTGRPQGIKQVVQVASSEAA